MADQREWRRRYYCVGCEVRIEVRRRRELGFVPFCPICHRHMRSLGWDRENGRFRGAQSLAAAAAARGRNRGEAGRFTAGALPPCGRNRRA